MAEDYSNNKQRKFHEKEAFVTGHDGTTPHEILLLCLIVPVGLHLYCRLVSWLDALRHHGHRRAGRHSSGSLDGTAIEFASMLVPMLLVQTSLLPNLAGPVVLMAGMLAFASCLHRQAKRTVQGLQQSTQEKSCDQEQQMNMDRPLFLSIHRGSVYLLTTIAILAVDFPIFPRRFCKTETVGYGWMDLGAASFIIIAGWTSASTSTSKYSSLSSIRKLLKKCTPLLFLGLIRLATNKGLEYQEHVSEYGVHWNFFFTLCFVEGFMVFWKGFKSQFSPDALGKGRQERRGLVVDLPLDFLFALGLMIPYQMYLTIGGGQDFIENGERRCHGGTPYPWLCGAFVANREGILGVFGYLSLRLISEDVARYCLWPHSTILRTIQSKKDDNMTETALHNTLSTFRQRRMSIMVVLLWTIHFALVYRMEIPTSRRSTNVSFILWALAHNLTILLCIHSVIIRSAFSEFGSDISTRFTPKLLHAANKFGLAVFLTSNIMTGLVNLSVDTLHSSDAEALVVLSIYLTLVCGGAFLLATASK
mmetsp:Transcript_906/g.1793  ORF Transcript_906/g.1793 Transcript_906/m.1793 type:complete len:533 (+) Transcript_906:74-1672(+)